LTEIVIKIRDYIGIHLSLRYHIEDLFNDIKSRECDDVVLDFDSVEFASRSSLQELHYQITACNKHIILINMIDVVAQMFEIVKNPKDKEIIFNYDPRCVTRLSL
jgi:anti-anti-sigma regulatory factor